MGLVTGRAGGGPGGRELRSPLVAQLVCLEKQARTCKLCALSATRTNVVFGTGDPEADLMFVGEGPGHDEDIAGEPFVGRSGKLLDMLVSQEMGLDRTRFYIANVVKCRPPGNRDPRPEEVESCRPYLQRQIELIDPVVVVTLGNFALHAVLETPDGINKARGRAYPLGPRVVVPTYHPAFALRGGGDVVAAMRADLIRAKRALRGDL